MIVQYSQGLNRFTVGVRSITSPAAWFGIDSAGTTG